MQIHKIFVLFLALSSLIYPLSASSRHVKEIGREDKAHQAEALMEESEMVPILGAGEEFGLISKGRGRMDIEINDYQLAGPNERHSYSPPGGN
ncbi:unnamed protein product [Cuscuta epithymum]|uniref:Uncharacterized protein n=1 Tax=Cuscuta epithymum TaxID=186058 RepID=A0AAV0C6A7_9ASTE|nr:unnamed protein product [Cuscuta epithymum]